MPRVIVAMSGGLDSAVSAALLIEEGLDVAGLTMRIWHEDMAAGALDGEIASAERVCDDLGIDHHVVDLSAAFERLVVLPFVDAYASGRTPNPCILCNPHIKFGLLWKHAHSLGADAMATGHYCRIERPDGRFELWRGADRSKDQSYFLYRLGQAELSRTLFPLGGWTKRQARDYAQTHGLRVTERPESQDICFLRDGDYRRFLREQAPWAFEPGPILDVDGNVLGEHHGLAAYTVGQRRGLGIAAPEPLYVLRLEPSGNALIVGYREALGCDTLETIETTWVSGFLPPPSVALQAQIRYRAQPVGARITEHQRGRLSVSLDAPLRDIMPGQSAVFYDNDRVVGGGIISSTGKSQ